MSEELKPCPFSGGEAKMSKNKNLTKAKKAKYDEFYTVMEDIKKELDNYDFTDKVVYCNCDAPDSNFIKYFENKPVRKLLATGIKDGIGYRYEDGTVSHCDGDFRHNIDTLLLADVVVTNPPFSLFSEYVAQLVEYDKKFIIIGNKNAVKYKEIFPLIKDNKIWLGATNFNNGMYFKVPENFIYAPTYKFERERNGEKVNRVPGVRWFTNLEIPKLHEELTLYKRYSPEEFPKYDNYDAINVDKTADIPYDYDGVIGVPITFLDKYNPEQFEIVGVIAAYSNGKYAMSPKAIVNGKELYTRILIRRKDVVE